GEEILVLDGVFQDERGDYPAGSYVRNPPGTSHVPASREGCTIFVRLWQFREGDDVQVVCRAGEGRKVQPRTGATAATVLFDDGHEEVRIEDWTAGARVVAANQRGLEFLVLAGGLRIGDEQLESQSWGRLPAGTHLVADVGPSGARIWMKDAPLLHADVRQIPGP
ncbi:MAG TPA: cupin domain-containing protein, partial [Pseudolabrys sp.]|nr:cupin domain-containing protein [Pseudolabrys sp.]